MIAIGNSVLPEAQANSDVRLELIREIKGVCGPFHAVLMDGDVYCVEYRNCVIKKIHQNGRYEWLGALDENSIATTWQSDRSKPAGCSKQLERPHTIKRYGNLLEISLLGSNDILTIDKAGVRSRKHYDRIKGDGLVSVAYTPDGFTIAIDYRNEVVQRRRGDEIEFLGCPTIGFTKGWSRSVKFSESSKDCGFIRPHEVLVRGEYLYVADTGNHRIKRYSLDGRFAGWIGKTKNGSIKSGWTGTGEAVLSLEPGGFSEPVSMTFDKAGNLYVLDYGSGRLQIISEAGAYIAGFDFNGRVKNPYGVSIEEDLLIISNTGRGELLLFKVRQ